MAAVEGPANGEKAAAGKGAASSLAPVPSAVTFMHDYPGDGFVPSVSASLNGCSLKLKFQGNIVSRELGQGLVMTEEDIVVWAQQKQEELLAGTGMEELPNIHAKGELLDDHPNPFVALVGTEAVLSAVLDVANGVSKDNILACAVVPFRELSPVDGQIQAGLRERLRVLCEGHVMDAVRIVAGDEIEAPTADVLFRDTLKLHDVLPGIDWKNLGEHEGEHVLICLSLSYFSGNWHFKVELPGGKRKLAETTTDAAVREFWEETSLQHADGPWLEAANLGGAEIYEIESEVWAGRIVQRGCLYVVEAALVRQEG